MKTIVFADGKKHSAWDDAQQARKQVRTLIDYGYKDVHFEYIDHNYENGHYFV